MRYLDYILKVFAALFLVVGLMIIPFSCQQVQNKTKEVPKKIVKHPNIIIIYCDDLGYADISCFGAENIKTPNIDKLAEDGMKLTNFYVASAICSPSRAALLTGSYPVRVGIPKVLAPHGIWWAGDSWRLGLNSQEETLAELLKDEGYGTAIFGKWHLGHLKEHLPIHHGFDHFFGTPYSNDMLPEHDESYPPLPIIEDTVIVEENPDQRQFTRRFTEKMLDFIEQGDDQPFFAYLAYPMPHVPIFASSEYEGVSEDGLYGDVIEELDAHIGKIISFLEDRGIRQNTIVIFTSDNGPWLAYGNHAGSAGLLREGKNTTMDGGNKVPFIISWPDRIKSRMSDEIVTNMDLLPTLIEWAGADQPSNQIDGVLMNDFFEGKTKDSSRDELLYYSGEELQAMRKGVWKIHKPHTYQKIGDNAGRDGEKGDYQIGEIGWALFNLKNDPGERYNLAEENKLLLDSLKQIMLNADNILRKETRSPYIYSGDAPPTGKLWHN